MNNNEVETLLKNGKQVRITLNGAKVISSKTKLIAVSKYTNVKVKSLVVVDPEYGAVYISSGSTKVRNVDNGDMLFGKVLITKLGDKNERFENYMKFSKIIPGKLGQIVVEKRLDS